jgi:hypothetical protein
MTEHWDWPPLFLEALAASGLIRASARAVGIGRRTTYDKRERDPEFAAAWDAAVEPFRAGERACDRRPLAAFPAHAALAPLDKVSAECGAVTIDELEGRLGCSLEQFACKVERYPISGDVETWRLVSRYSHEIRGLANGSPSRVHRARHAVGASARAPVRKSAGRRRRATSTAGGGVGGR